MRYSIFILLFFLCLILTTGCDRPEAIKPSGITIKVGVIGPFSGPDRALGEDSLRGIRTVMHMQPFLDNGDKVELVIEDDKNDPSLSVKALKKLTTKDKVSAILLLSSSTPALAVNELADSYQVPVLVLVATHPDIAKDKTFVSQLIFDNIFQGSVAALFVRDELLIDTVAVFHNKESAYSTSLAYEFIRKFGTIGGKITANIDVPETGDADDLKNIMEMLQRKKTQLLYLPIAAKDFIRISKALNETGWAPERVGRDGLDARVMREYPEETGLLEGIYDIDLYADDVQGTSFCEQAKKAYRQLFKKKSNSFTAIGAEGYAILQHAMNRCSRPDDGQCINTMIHNTDSFEGLLGRISIFADGKAERTLIINRVRKGQARFVVKVY